jgi:hypothetical protein
VLIVLRPQHFLYNRKPGLQSRRGPWEVNLKPSAFIMELLIDPLVMLREPWLNLKLEMNS